jgi:hypothetical protein
LVDVYVQSPGTLSFVHGNHTKLKINIHPLQDANPEKLVSMVIHNKSNKRLSTKDGTYISTFCLENETVFVHVDNIVIVGCVL